MVFHQPEKVVAFLEFTPAMVDSDFQNKNHKIINNHGNQQNINLENKSITWKMIKWFFKLLLIQFWWVFLMFVDFIKEDEDFNRIPGYKSKKLKLNTLGQKDQSVYNEIVKNKEERIKQSSDIFLNCSIRY